MLLTQTSSQPPAGAVRLTLSDESFGQQLLMLLRVNVWLFLLILALGMLLPGVSNLMTNMKATMGYAAICFLPFLISADQSPA